MIKSILPIILRILKHCLILYFNHLNRDFLYLLLCYWTDEVPTLNIPVLFSFVKPQLS